MSSIRKAMGALPWGHVYHLNNSESPTPKDVFWIRWNSYFLGPLSEPIIPPPSPLPPPGPIGATLGTVMNNFNSSHKKTCIWILHNLTVLLLDLKMLLWNLHGFSPWEPSPWAPMGPHVWYEQLWIPAPKDDSWQVWLKSDQAFSRSRWNSYFLHKAPSPTGAHWGHPGNCHKQSLFFT